MEWWVLSIIGFVLALGPSLLLLRNLGLYRRPEGLPRALGVSILIPARNEASGIRESVQAALATTGIAVEVVVLDDHSTDGTDAMVRELATADSRVRLEVAPPLPAGWCGKQHACWLLSQRARYDVWAFLDADVRLQPDGLSRAVSFLERSGAGLVSGVPRQVTVTVLEVWLIPLIHFVLLGFLPLDRMRRERLPAYGAGCGQLFLTQRKAYQQSGGHAVIRESMHDGVRLPRAYRAAGLMTDLFDATDVASCRMYRHSSEVWRGLSKNAVEGLAAPAMIVPATVLLAGGHVLPPCLAALGASGVVPLGPAVLSAVAWLMATGVRGFAGQRFQQSPWSAISHPLAVVVFLVLQWSALARWLAGRPSEWKGRSTPKATEAATPLSQS